MFWVMWREWQVWISLLKNITFLTSRWLIETIIWDIESTTKTWFNSLINNFEWKISSLRKLEKAFNWWKSSWIIKEAWKQTKRLIQEIKIVHLLRKHWNNKYILKQELKKLQNKTYISEILSEINKDINIKIIKQKFWNKIETISRSKQTWTHIKQSTASLWKWDFSQTEKALYNYYNNLDSIRKNNKRILSWGFNKLKLNVKYRDFIDSMKLSRNGNRIILEWSLQEQKHSTNMLKKMANDAPLIIRWSFRYFIINIIIYLIIKRS